ncbi:ComEC/Rec2 family competence protein [Naasia sp. SYSU D00057]|uniref:ComEC/Rec2 family competence protein n=1 Tax=Naasia sp. SYSU D00057 TaxID=2817380 RepID=UPI001B315860|nr:ComEC/Rec2 family competence protein [Naasia sp. SYSU D00057]
MSADARLVPAAAGAWAGAALLVGTPALAPVAAPVLGAVAAAAVLAARRSVQLAAALVAVALLAGAGAATAAAIAVRAPERSPAALTRALADAGTAELVLTGVPRRTAGVLTRTIVEADLVRFTRGSIDVSARTPVLLFVAGSPDQQALAGSVGSRIEARVRLAPAVPGEDVAYLGSAERLRPLAPAPPWLAWAAALRERFAASAARLPGDGAALLPGLAIGADGDLPAALREDMRDASLSHLTAVSGANCAVVVAVVLALARVAGLRRGPRLVLAGLALLAFVVLVTPQPSVLRAAVMGVLVLAAGSRGRAGGGLPALAAAVVVLLCADPWLARDAGFALSVAATGGLVVLAGPATELLARVVPGPLAAALAVPACAQLACQPVLVLLDPALTLAAVPANLLAAPAAPLATLAGLAACLVLPLAPPVGDLLTALGWLPSAWIAAVARAVSAVGAGRVPWPEGASGALLLVAVLLLAGVALLRRQRPPAAIAAALVAAALGAGAAAQLGRAASMPPDWQIASCDIGQGDASVLRSGGRFALIDAGDDPEALTDCRRRLGASRIDLLVLTHFDLDHVGAAASLVGAVDTVLIGPSDGPDADRLAARFAESGAGVHTVAAGDEGVLGALRWRVLWPPADSGVQPGNDASVVLEVTGGGLKSLFLGDLGEEAQNSMLRRAGPGPVDVVKVAHHGSADQSVALYERLGARVGLISCGSDNTYGHPTRRLLGILRRTGTTALRTDRSGMLLVAAGPSGVAVWTERAAS